LQKTDFSPITQEGIAFYDEMCYKDTKQPWEGSKVASNNSRYKALDALMTKVLIADGGILLLYLLFAGLGVGFLKVVLAILGLGLSALCLVFLYLTNELLRKRSLWMTAGAAAVIICILVSLIANYPSPDPLKRTPKETVSYSQFLNL
jgi:hypothetical protein